MIQATANFSIFSRNEVAQNTAFVNKSGRRSVRNWEVIFCPTGDFLGRCFRTFDLTGARNTYWDQGMIFKNKKTGATWTWNGSEFTKSNPESNPKQEATHA